MVTARHLILTSKEAFRKGVGVGKRDLLCAATGANQPGKLFVNGGQKRGQAEGLHPAQAQIKKKQFLLIPLQVLNAQVSKILRIRTYTLIN